MAYIDYIHPSAAPESAAVTFSGHGEDSDGTIVAREWTSSLDGRLASIEHFTNSSLSVGIHNISFRVKDNDGAWSDAATAKLVIGATSNMDSAVNILLDAVLPNISEVKSDELYVCLKLDTSLPRNTTIVEDVESGLTITLHEEIFLFLLDIAPGEQYPHPLKYILINIEGKHEVFDASGLPMIDGWIPESFSQTPPSAEDIVATNYY